MTARTLDMDMRKLHAVSACLAADGAEALAAAKAAQAAGDHGEASYQAGRSVGLSFASEQINAAVLRELA